MCQIHQLTTSKQYELRISAQFYNDSGNNVFMQYAVFTVSDAASGYRLFANATTDVPNLLGDCFSALYGARFSTADSDNDEDPGVNCGAKHRAGWWFRGSGGCSTCNPTGPWVDLPADGQTRPGADAETFWTQDMGQLAMSRIIMYLVVL